MKRVLLLDHAIAGLHHHVDRDLAETLREDQELTLVREPTNEYDRFAVRIDCGSSKLGYIPRTYSQMVSTLLVVADVAGYTLEADIGDTVVPRKALVHFRLWIKPD